MAWIRKKSSGAFLVGWREDGKKRSRQFGTREEAEAHKAKIESEAIAREVPSQEREWTPSEVFAYRVSGITHAVSARPVAPRNNGL